MNNTTKDDPPEMPVDAAPPPKVASVGKFLERARSRGFRAHGMGGMRRIVVRFDPATIARLDALLPHWPDASRAALVRAFTLFGLAAVEANATPVEGGTP
jgi:hypothetical protein